MTVYGKVGKTNTIAVVLAAWRTGAPIMTLYGKSRVERLLLTVRMFTATATIDL